MEYHLTFENAIIALKSGKKIKNEDWGNKYYHHLEIIHTQDFKDTNIICQPFIAIFFKNGNFMPHPYSFTDLDIFSNTWVITE